MTQTRLALLLAIACALASPAYAQTPSATVTSPDGTAMTQYYLVLLRRGPAWTARETPETKRIGDAHLANIQRLAKAGTMVVAGPFDGQTGDRALAGLFILRVGSMQEATTVVQTDPAVKARRFTYDIVPWWGPKSLRY